MRDKHLLQQECAGLQGPAVSFFLFFWGTLFFKKFIWKIQN